MAAQPTPSVQSAPSALPAHVPELDGLRGVAVAVVVVHNLRRIIEPQGDTASLLWVQLLDRGWIGVQLFFVLSGFLITRILLRSRAAENYYSGFFARRALRILPLYYAALLLWLVVLPAIGWEFPHDKSTDAYLWVFLSNWVQPFHTGGALIHFWSLAVEEQFYLLFPLLLMFLARRRHGSIPRTIALLAAGSFVLSVAGSYTYTSATFYLLPTRAWELLMGAFLAATTLRQPAARWVSETAGWLGVSLIVCSVFFYDLNTRFPGLAAIPPCLGAALIIFASETKPALVGRLLALKPVVFVGLISYSLYLWHWPLLVLFKYQTTQMRDVNVRVLLLLASAGLAILSWKFVETPFRKRRIFNGRRPIMALAGCSMLILVLLGLAVARDGVPSRIPSKALDYADTRNHRAFLNQVSLEQAVAGKFVELGTQNASAPISVLIWGDSHAMSVTPVIDELCRQYAQRGIQATHSSTAPVLGYVSTGAYSLKGESPAFANAVISFVAKNHVRNVIVTASWSTYPASDSFKAGVRSTIQAIMDAGAKVYVLKDVPFPGYDVPTIAALTVRRDGDLEQLTVSPEKHAQRNSALRQTFDDLAKMGATVLDPSECFLNSNRMYGLVRNGQVLFCDEHHLTVEGARLLAPLFEPIFRLK